MKTTNLIESLFAKRNHFEIAVCCTYTCDLHFFENYLMKQEGFFTCENIVVFTDSRTYENFINASYQPRFFNRKYLVSRIVAKGVFHPKIYLFASEEKAMFAIGSANMTRDGIASNLEINSVFEVTEKDRTHAFVLRDCIDYISRLAGITKSKKATEQIRSAAELCSKFIIDTAPSNNSPVFIHNLDIPLMDRILEIIGNVKVNSIQIISPFYDTELAALKEMYRLFSSATIEIYLQQGKSNMPVKAYSGFSKKTNLFAFENIDRYLHGKAIVFKTAQKTYLFTGSANFTYPALFQNSAAGNYETGLIGEIDAGIDRQILSPLGKEPKKIEDLNKIKTIEEKNIEISSNNIVNNYIIEAVEINNSIEIEINTEINKDVIKPQNVRIGNFQGMFTDRKYPPSNNIPIDNEIKKKVPGTRSIQIIGIGSSGGEIKSNISWVINLEETHGNSYKRKLRQVYNNPFDLPAILLEIIHNGSSDELIRFLMEYDIPLDLIMPPRSFVHGRSRDSRGNLEGFLPTTYDHKFTSSDMLSVYYKFIERQFDKLEKHIENPQIKSINNFMMIYLSIYSFLEFINLYLFENKKSNSVFEVDEWKELRDYYNLIFKFAGDGIDILYEEDGYRDAINERIEAANTKSKIEESEIASFEKYIDEIHVENIVKSIKVVEDSINSYEYYEKRIPLRTIKGQLVKAKSFSQDVFINEREVLKKKIKKISRVLLADKDDQ